MKISYVFTCGRLESLFKILSLIQQGGEQITPEAQQIIDKFRKDIASGRSFESTQLYKLIEKSEDKIVINRLSNIFRDKPDQQNKFDLKEYEAGVWSEFSDYKLAIRFSNAKTQLSQKHFEKTGEYMTSRGIAKLTGFNPTNIKNMLNHKRSVVRKMLTTLEKLAKEY